MKSNMLPTVYQQYIAISRYARWLPEHNRREHWDETVTRYFDFFEKFLMENYEFDIKKNKLRDRLETAVLNLEVLPSMRSLMTAGPALEQNHIAGYNCSFSPPVTHAGKPDGFAEAMFILLSGTGFGGTVEAYWVDQLPVVPDKLYNTDTTIVVADSKLGWAKSFKELIHLLYAGQIPQFDVSKVRPSGAKLKTFGGRASGPEPLVKLFNFTIETFRKSVGRRLHTIEVSDIINMIGDIVVVGGVRRSAEIIISDLEDDRMRHAKSGNWYDRTPWRRLANISAVYNEKPTPGTFMREWASLYESKSGERGIFSRVAVETKIRTMLKEHRKPWPKMGTNPCGEILLRPWQFCNLTTWVPRSGDTLEDMLRKIELATILGTFQSLLTDFKFLSSQWKKNCEEERLLGVSICGVMGHPVLAGKEGTDKLKEYCIALREKARKVNAQYAKTLGINESAAITCVKPEGTVSQLVSAESGIHDAFAPHYIRRVRADIKDPVTKVMIDLGFPHEPDLFAKDSTMVFSFPQKADPKSSFRNQRTAIQQLEHWSIINEFYCEHNPSVTIFVKEDEWVNVGAWVYDHFDKVQGVSFLPFSDHIYQQAPYEEITEEAYEEFLAKMPKDADWSLLAKYEHDDETIGAQELACSAGNCSIDGR